MNYSIGIRERGSAGIKAIVAIIILALAIYAGITMIPIYAAHYKLEDNIKEDILFAQQRFKGDLEEEFTASVVTYLNEMGVTYDKKNVRVSINSGARSIKVELWYERQHEIPGFPKQFKLSVDGKYGL